MKGGKILMTVQNYQQCAMHGMLDVTGLPLGWLIGSHIEF